MKKKHLLIWFTLFFVLTAGVILLVVSLQPSKKPGFDSSRAYQDIIQQTQKGSRIPGSVAHAETIQYICGQLKPYGWELVLQELTVEGHPVKNIIAKRGSGTSWIILGAHYDTRAVADQDLQTKNHSLPVPGANDGASGVAVLLELGRSLPASLDKQIWLVFFDAEDQGSLPGWNWILGSTGFASQLSGKPDAVVILDMIGDADLNIFQEWNSDPALTKQIWNTAAKLGYSQFFIPETKYSLEDDHFPFLKRGISAIDIIDFDYPYWHKTTDTAEKVTSQSLGIVGNTIYSWLTEN